MWCLGWVEGMMSVPGPLGRMGFMWQSPDGLLLHLPKDPSPLSVGCKAPRHAA